MKNRSKFWLNAAILCLIWTVYYYAKRYTGGVIDTKDNIVCGIIGLSCVMIIVMRTIKNRQNKNGNEQ